MKKLFLGAAIAMSSLTFAQQFGLKAGMNVSSLSKTSSMDDAKAKVGFNAGVFMNAPIAENFSIQPELIYSQYGNKATNTSTATSGGTTITRKTTGSTILDYLALPVMFQYNATPSFYLEAGPEFGLLLSGKTKGEVTTTTTTGTSTTTSSSSGSDDIKDNLNGFNFGVGLGAGYYFTPNIGVNARYVAGFTDIVKNNNGDAVKNNVFQVGLNYKF
ncbi:PorT family protein [Chryseobacterium suipulveris]|uniref:PorT family protein n=1 Tax=Chryseobacterium suipulveris TaxID=2929800 RepID=A0ABY4BS61_9FLAO|nr:porin family protein [Chryseobacterium suipulveris]UOE42037.1 PorT family protein [Chryseobacterium suipulveris]